jgi:two-component system, cell cycle sensor histidine kinase and response regulator CckA
VIPSQRKQYAGVVLAADDEPAVLTAICQTLRSEGFRVLAACDGEQALDMLCYYGDEVDLALVDLSMPKIGGADLISRFLPVMPNLKALFLCGHPDEAPAKELKREGRFRVIYKPFTPDLLLSVVHASMDGLMAREAAS